MKAYKIYFNKFGEIIVGADSFTSALDKFYEWYVQEHNDINYEVKNIELIGSLLTIPPPSKSD